MIYWQFEWAKLFIALFDRREDRGQIDLDTIADCYLTLRSHTEEYGDQVDLNTLDFQYERAQALHRMRGLEVMSA